MGVFKVFKAADSDKRASRKDAPRVPSKPAKRCRHVWGPEQADGPGDEHRVCRKCGRLRFRGERYVFGSRWR